MTDNDEAVAGDSVAFALVELVELASEQDDDYTTSLFEGATCRTFAESGVLSGNAGVVLRLADGSEYQLSLVRSK